MQKCRPLSKRAKQVKSINMTTDTFATLPLGSIVTSPTNPRKSFNPLKLTELTESIRLSGVHQPILVRPLPGARVADTPRGITHEIVCGERRYRASVHAGVPTIPALIRDLTDAQVLEIQLVENLQRDDLTELEEAEGYQALMQASGLNAEAIGDKISKSRSYVFGRLKLLDLSVECKQALRDGHIDASRALLIARIPDTALQTKALAQASAKGYDGDVQLSYRAFASWLQTNVMLRLDRATFNPADSTLVIGVGNCSTCPKRTGANPDLFADVQNADICTDPACYHDKEEAHRNSVLDTAAKRGMRLIDGQDAADICHQYHNGLDGYSPLTQERNDTADGQPATLGQLLGKDAPAPVLIENPWTKKLIAAVPTDEAEAMLLARGLVKALQAKEAKAKSADTIQADIKTLQAKAEKATTTLFRKMAMQELAALVHACDDAHAHKLVYGLVLRAWWLRQVEGLDYNDLTIPDMARMFDLTLADADDKTPAARDDAHTTQIRLHVQACSQGKLYKALVLYFVRDDLPDYFYNDIPEPTLFTALASEMGFDLDALDAQATAQVRAETADELKKLKAQLTDAKKAPVPLVSAAQAKGSGVGKTPKTKTTAAQAQAQIAAALQAQDTTPGADAQGIAADSSQPVATPGASAPTASQSVGTPVEFDLGQRVRVTTDDNKLGRIAAKWGGKVGTVTQREPGGGYWNVTFKGRGGGIALFAADQIELVQSAVLPESAVAA